MTSHRLDLNRAQILVEYAVKTDRVNQDDLMELKQLVLQVGRPGQSLFSSIEYAYV